jgi:hypothetical protein
MTANAAQLDARNSGNRPLKTTNKLRLVGLRDLDGRTAATKRARAFAAALAEELGGSSLTASQSAAVERAACLVALAEDTRSRRLAGDQTISLDDLVRVDAAADRALRRLGIKPGAPKPHVPLRDVLMAEAAAREPSVETEAEGA